MKNHFDEYVKEEFKKMDLLSFYVKKLVQIYLPNIHNYFVKIKINLDIYVSSWCLTLFTSILHSLKESVLLDEIIDIFIAKKWVGFF